MLGFKSAYAISDLVLDSFFSIQEQDLNILLCELYKGWHSGAKYYFVYFLKSTFMQDYDYVKATVY